MSHTTMPVSPGPPKAPPKPDTLPHKAAKLVHLGRTPQQRKTAGAPVGVDNEADEYPYGLGLELEDDSMEKLGLSANPPAVGSTIHATVQMHVRSARKEPGSKRSSLGVTVTHMAVHPSSAPAHPVKRAAPRAGAPHVSASPAKTVKVMAHVRRAKGQAPAPPVHVPMVKQPTAHRVTRAR